jgi:hypothetical protein
MCTTKTNKSTRVSALIKLHHTIARMQKTTISPHAY